jgi:hypothetical protein
MSHHRVQTLWIDLGGEDETSMRKIEAEENLNRKTRLLPWQWLQAAPSQPQIDV